MIEIIIGVIFISGVLGGLINSFIADAKTENPLTWWKHIFVGIGAAFMVPVFLNMISSKLIAEIKGPLVEGSNLSNLLILAGFCLIAAVSSRAFIRSLSASVLKQVSEAKQDAAEAKAAVAPFIEPDVVPQATKSGSQTILEMDLSPLTSDEERVLNAMITSTVSMRSLTGIANDSGLDKSNVNASITSLVAKGFVVQGTSPSGQPRWYLTHQGRVVAVEKK